VNADAALIWLNDRLGKNVFVWVAVKQGEFEVGVIDAQGLLRHWSHGEDADDAVGREDIAGLYEVGATSIDLSDVRPVDVATWPDNPEHLMVRLDENTTLHVSQQRSPAAEHPGQVRLVRRLRSV